MGNEQSVSVQDLEEIRQNQKRLAKENQKLKRILREQRSVSSVSKESTPPSSSNKARETVGFSGPIGSQEAGDFAVARPLTSKRSAPVPPTESKPATPYDILGVDPDAPFETIRAQYKDFVRQYHPDRNPDPQAARIFRVVQSAFEQIQKEHAAQQRPKERPASHFDLAEEREQEETDTRLVSKVMEPASGGAFSRARFNEMYEQHRFRDEDENDGYQDWMKANPQLSDTIQKRFEFTKDRFQSEFQKEIQAVSSKRDVIQHRDPSGYVYGKNFETLGGSKRLDDYTNDDPFSRTKYTDYKKAFTEENILFPGEVQPRDQYASLEQIKSKRAQPIREQDETERAYYQTKEQQERAQEEERQIRLKERDSRIQKHYQNIHHRALPPLERDLQMEQMRKKM